MSRKVWINGKILDESEAKISVYDSALMFGDLQFTMLRTFDHIPFQLDAHLDRLFKGLKIFRIKQRYTKEHLKKVIQELIEINDFDCSDEHRIMIDISRGLLGLYDGKIESVESGSNVIITDFPLCWTVAGMGTHFDYGLEMVIPSQRAIPSQYLDPKIKSRSRQHLCMANIQASLYKGNPWALLLDDRGCITEGTGDNFFIIKDKEIISPKSRNILGGISRKYVKELIDNNLYDFRYVEKDIEPYDVYTADEAFITGSPFCILPVTRVDGLYIDEGHIGKTYRKILNLWSGFVGVDIEKQIKSWDKDNPAGVTPYNFGDV